MTPFGYTIQPPVFPGIKKPDCNLDRRYYLELYRLHPLAPQGRAHAAVSPTPGRTLTALESSMTGCGMSIVHVTYSRDLGAFLWIRRPNLHSCHRKNRLFPLWQRQFAPFQAVSAATLCETFFETAFLTTS